MSEIPELLTLNEACERFFRGLIKPSTLRARAAEGKLRLTRIGKRHFVTAEDLAAMVRRCRDEPRDPASTSTNARAASPSGSSETERIRSARAALRATLQGPNEPSKSRRP